MNKGLTRFVLAITAVALAVVPVKVSTRGTDSATPPVTCPSEDRMPQTGWTCGGRAGRPCNACLVEIRSPLARDSVVEEEAKRWVDHWWTGGQGSVQRGLERMGRYEDYIDAELAIRTLPPSLRYLPLIESGYNHLAVSPAGAAGLWQLMPETARGLGLQVDSLVDQRFDAYLSTQAALDYLVALHDRFQCWSLALAAYNVGPTRVERAIRWHGGSRPRNDALFLHIRDWLPRETQDFVPKFLATIRLAGDPSVIRQRLRVEGAASAHQSVIADHQSIIGVAPALSSIFEP
ncbi:MAG: lytic transglycosylase domain-containing protein [Gemmatimonadota bacterium]|nr:lytic transglycosylase domain-containing protein [Gemmatimonadota bacterium]